MKRIFFLLITFNIVFFLDTKSQDVSINIQSGYGVFSDNSIGGRASSFGLDYLHKLKPKTQVIVGANFNIEPWTTDLTLNFGLKYTYEITTKWNWVLKAETEQGVALFKQHKLYVWGLSGTTGVEYKLNSISALSLSTGLRYTHCPAYANYGLINSFLELPIEIAYRFKFSK
jgi:hypothetical protein